MQLRKWSASMLSLGVLALTGCMHAREKRDGDAFRAENAREVEVLVAHASAGDLATAAVLASVRDPNPRQPLELIERAEKLAPQRPELVWLHLAICERLDCDAKEQIKIRLQTVDPENGFVWATDLRQAQLSGADAAITAAIVQIGSKPRMTLYWNQLTVMMVDSLAVANPSQSLTSRGWIAAGLLGGQAIPPFQPIATACRVEQLDLPGRRAACEALVARMEHSSTILTQSLAISMQERWWPAGSPQHGVLRAKRRRIDYLTTMSNRIRWWRTDRDMAVRIEAQRQCEREEDVELAIVKSQGLPPEPPAGWKDTLHPG